MQELFDKQRTFFNSGITKDLRYRKSQLLKLKAILKSYEQEMYKAVYEDFAKSAFDTYSNELSLLYSDISDYCRNLSRFSRTRMVGTNIINFPAKSSIIPEPLGVCVVIGAWNYPYQLSFAPAIAAIAAGNTVILKPSEISPNTSSIIARIVNENFDENFFKVVEGGVSETTDLLKCKCDKIFFTGSPKVGKIVYEAAAKNLVPVTLELGGKSPVFITETCDFGNDIKRLVWAKFVNAGQTCIAPDYFFVHKSVKNKFFQAVKKEIENNKYSLENENYVRIINDKNMQRLAALIDPEKVCYGGICDFDERLISPTILQNVSFSDKIMQEEIFGPIIPIIEYENLDEAIASVKVGEKPLSCYILTKDKKQKTKILSEVSFGGGCVNDAIMHITNSKLPFGGVGNSGIGSYHGKAGFDAFTHYKSILEKPLWLELPLKYPPYTNLKFSLIKKIMK